MGPDDEEEGPEGEELVGPEEGEDGEAAPPLTVAVNMHHSSFIIHHSSSSLFEESHV